MTFDPGVPLTRELIRDNADDALAHIAQLAQRADSAEELVAALRTQLQARETGLAAAERRAAEAAEQGESLRRQLLDTEQQRSSLLTGQEEALRAYRELVLQANPHLPPELISGGALHELQTSIEAARAVVGHVQAALEKSNAASRVPAGAPLRTLQPDPTTMTAAEKLLYGVRQARGEEPVG